MLVQTQTGFDSLGTRRLNHELRILSKESYSQSGDKLETEADWEILNKLSWRESAVCRLFHAVCRSCPTCNSSVQIIRNSLELRTTRHQLNLFALRKFKSPRYPFVFETQSQFAWLMQRQFTLHLHFVFNRNECAQPECGVFFTTSPPHARCLTLTLAPDGAGPGCFSGSRMSRSAALSLPARA